MTNVKRKKDLFAGSLTQNILLFTLPIIATSVLQLLFNTADLAVVGFYRGETAVAAVGSTTSMIHLIVNLLIGLSVGASVLVAQEFCAKDHKMLEKSVHTALMLAFWGGILFGGIGFFLARPILEWMKTDPSVIDGATLYVKIYFIGVPTTMLYNFGAAILRAVREMRQGDLLLILAKACPAGQLVGGRLFPFDERQILRDAWRKALGGSAENIT